MISLLLSLPFLVLALYAVHAAFKYTRMINNIFLSLVYSPPEEPSESSRGEPVTILDSADREIKVLWVESKNSKKAAIFCHESGAAKESWEKYLWFLPSMGFHVVSVDFSPAPDVDPKDSLSQWPTEEDVERLLTVVRWSKKAFEPGSRIVLAGVSKGANIALAASLADPSVAAVVTDGLFSMKEIFRDYIRKWAPVLVKPNLFGERYPDWVVNVFTNLGLWYSQKKSKKRFLDVEQILRKRHAPLFMAYGAEDDYVPSAHQEFLARISRAGEAVQRLVVPEAGHNEAVIVGRRVYEDEIRGFLRKAVP